MQLIRKHKKRFYVPGMISLVLIPLVCIAWLFLHKDFNPPNYLTLPVADEEFVKTIKKEIGAFPVPRTYQEFTFNGTNHINAAKMKAFRMAIRKMKQTNDTVTGIKVHFAKDSDYETFINVFDLLAIEGMPTYLPYKDDVWILMPIKKKKATIETAHHSPPPCGSGGFSMNFKIKEEKDDSLLIAHYKGYSALLGGWTLMLCLNIFVLIKWNRNKTYLQKPYI